LEYQPAIDEPLPMKQLPGASVRGKAGDHETA
jgi:hypothetical protein